MTINIQPYYFLNICASFLMQIVALVLVYILSPEEYGYYALITSAAQILYILCSGWSNATVLNIGTKRFHENGTYKDVIIYRAIIVSVCFLFLSLVFIFFKTIIVNYVGNENNYLLTFLFFLGLVAYDFSFQILYPGEKNNLQASLVFVANFLIFVYVILKVKVISQYIYCYTAIYILLFLILISFFITYYRKDRFFFNLNDFRYILRYSFWQLFGVLGVYLINLGTNYVLRINHVDVGDIGLYNFAYKLFSCFVPIFALVGVVIPKWMNNKVINNKTSYIFTRMRFLIVCLIILYVISYFLLSPFLCFIHKEDYLASATMYIFLLPGFIFYAINQIINTIVLNTQYYRHSQFIALTQGIILLLSSFMLVHLFGMKGAIIANTLSFLVGTIWFGVLYKKKITDIIK